MNGGVVVVDVGQTAVAVTDVVGGYIIVLLCRYCCYPYYS